MKKLTQEEVKKRFVDAGCELLDVYINANSKVKYRCSCGNISYINLGNFSSGKRCIKCSGLEKKTQEWVENEFAKRKCILLDTYKNKESIMKYKCHCGKITYTSLSGFLKKKNCRFCNKYKKKTIEEVKNTFLENGCVLLENKYINSSTKMKYKCSCGSISYINLRNFSSGKRCKKCGIEKTIKALSISKEEVENIMFENGCVLLKFTSYKNNLEFICSCGKIGVKAFAEFKIRPYCKVCGLKFRSGKNHYNYNRDLSDYDRLYFRDYKEYQHWRKEVFERDNYTCIKCGNRGLRLNAHHIKNYSDNVELRLDIDNGITLCKKCHRIFHHLYGLKNNNMNQLSRFMSV